MVNLYLYLFILICSGLIFWGMVRLERVYQYPFFMGAIFVTFLIPQVFALHNNPGAVSQTALSRVFLMSCLCAGMCWLGYQINPNKNWLTKLNIPLENHKLFRMGIILLVIGYVFQILLWTTEIQTAANGNWTGKATIYLFFTRIIYISLVIFLLELINNPSVKNFFFTSLAIVVPFLTILEGRRQPTMTFLIIIGLSFWFVKRYVPPKVIFIILIVLGLYIIPLIGQLREDTWSLVAKRDWQTLASSSQESLELVMEGDILELKNAALIMDSSVKTGQYGYGTGYWDALVFQFVPGQIIGHDVKRSLQFQWGTGGRYLSYFYRYFMPSGTTPTGIGDSFQEFDYFGCLVFAFIGALFKTLWLSAKYYQSKFSILLYIGLMSPAMVAITHGTGRFIQEAVFQLIFVGLTVYLSRSNISSTYRSKKYQIFT